MQEMKTLWKEGINIVDGFRRQPFNLWHTVKIWFYATHITKENLVYITPQKTQFGLQHTTPNKQIIFSKEKV
jgi:hypothetical protein